MEEKKDILINSFEHYTSFVSKLANKQEKLSFPNSSAKHAAVVLANILRTCNDVHIYDTDINGDIAYQEPSFLSEFEKFSNSGKKLSIYLKNDDDIASQKLYKLISGTGMDNIKIFIVTNSFKDKIQEAKKSLKLTSDDINFAVADNRAIRLEEFSNGSYSAVCNFNDEKLANPLQNTLVEYSSLCNEYQIN